MNIGAPPAAPHAKPSAAAKVRADLLDPPLHGSPPFGDVVNDQPVEPGADGAVGFPLPAVRPTAQAAFAAQTAVGDAAVRFDARPIVAPSAEPLPTTAAHCLAERQAGLTPAMPDGGTMDVAELGAMVESLAGQLIAAASISPEASTMGRAAPIAPASVAAADGTTAPALPPPSTRRGFSAARTGAARPPLPATPIRAALERGPSARIAAFGDEIRILIRGVALSADDSAMLERIAREALGASAMADRPVRVIGSRKR